MDNLYEEIPPKPPDITFFKDGSIQIQIETNLDNIEINLSKTVRQQLSNLFVSIDDIPDFSDLSDSD